MELLWKLSELRTAAGDLFFSFVTRFGEETFILFIVCLTFWCLDKELAYRIGIAFFLSGAVIQTAKVTFRIDRPWLLDESFKPVDSALQHATGYSFPSGHTQAATSLYSSAAVYLKNKWLKTVCFALIFLVGFSRMYLGVHTPADVLTGFAVSLLISALVSIYLNKYHTRTADMAISIFLAVCAVICFIYPYCLYTGGVIELEYASDCAKQAGATLAFALGFFVERNYIKYEMPKKILEKVLVFSAGIAVTLALKSGLKPLFGATIAADTFRYFVTVSWVTILYPLLIKKVRQGKTVN